MGRITVGIDASKDSIRALHWALEEAALRGAELELVHAYPSPELVALPAVVTLPSDDELKQAATAVIDEAIEATGDLGDVSIIRTVRSGGPASVLCEAAQDADLLVVGARGLGGFRGLLLGSVSHQVVAHAPCPVVVVTPEAR